MCNSAIKRRASTVSSILSVNLSATLSTCQRLRSIQQDRVRLRNIRQRQRGLNEQDGLYPGRFKRLLTVSYHTPHRVKVLTVISSRLLRLTAHLVLRGLVAPILRRRVSTLKRQLCRRRLLERILRTRLKQVLRFVLAHRHNRVPRSRNRRRRGRGRRGLPTVISARRISGGSFNYLRLVKLLL